MLNACFVNTAHTKVIMKTTAELTSVKGSFVLVRLNKSRFHCCGYTSALSLKQLTADNAIFCSWGIKSLRDRCRWTGWYQASRTLYIMRSARDHHPAWACRLHSTLGLFGTLVLSLQGHFPVGKRATSAGL